MQRAESLLYCLLVTQPFRQPLMKEFQADGKWFQESRAAPVKIDTIAPQNNAAVS